MEFVQIIEMQTKRFDEIERLHEAWRAETEGIRTAASELVVKDRDRPDTYQVIVRFPSYEAAMENDALPATQKFAKEVGELLEGPPVFRNLDLVRFDT